MLNLGAWHFAFVNDSARVTAYAEAIAATVKSGDVVADLGAGTGVMALLASRAGAARVYAIESGGMVEMIRRIARANGLTDRVVCLYGESQRIELPERVDVVIADQTGPFGIGGGMFAIFNDARRRFLKPSGTTIPARVDLSLAAAEYPQGWAQIEFWDSQPAGFDMSALRGLARNAGYEVHFSPAELLSDPACVLSFNLAGSVATASSGAATLIARRAGTLHGLFGFFTAELAPGISISNSPLGPGTIDRHAWFMPAERPVALEPNDSIDVTMHMMPAEETVTWNIQVTGRDGMAKQKSTHSTFKGTPIAEEELQRTRPDRVPRLSAAGEAERAILDLCDGIRSVRQIAEEVRRRFPENFGAAGEADAAVSRMLRRNTR